MFSSTLVCTPEHTLMMWWTLAAKMFGVGAKYHYWKFTLQKKDKIDLLQQSIFRTDESPQKKNKEWPCKVHCVHWSEHIKKTCGTAEIRPTSKGFSPGITGHHKGSDRLQGECMVHSRYKHVDGACFITFFFYCGLGQWLIARFWPLLETFLCQ